MVSLEKVRTTTALLIDDDNVSNFIYKRVIEASGYFDAVRSYFNPKQALEQLQLLAEEDSSNFPSIIFLDLNMPDMNGWQFLDAYEVIIPKNIQEQCHVCILSSSVYLQDKLKSNEYKSVKEYIAKPLTSSNLDKIVKTYFTDT